MMKKMFLLGLLVFSCLGLVLGPVHSVQAADNTLVVATPEEIEGTDIQQVYWENIVHTLLYDAPVAFSLDMNEILPAMASDYEVTNDGKDITFTIPDNLAFTNGDPLTAADVKASMMRYKEVSPYASDLAPVQEIIVDGNKITLKCDQPPAFMWPVLATAYSGVDNTKAAAEMGKEAFNMKAVTNGLTSVAEWVQGSHITLKKNPYYKTNNPLVDNKGPLKVDKVKVRFISDNFTRVAELESGNVDMIFNVPVQNLAELENNKDVKILNYIQPGVDYIMMNTKVPGLDDVNVRKAISLAVNKSILKIALQNTVEPTYGMLSPATIGYNKETEAELKAEYEYNLDKAKQLLKDAGWEDKDGNGILEKGDTELSFTMQTALDVSAIQKSAPIIQAQLKKIGVNLKIREFESPYIKQQMNDGTYELATRHYVWADADILMYIIHSGAGFYSDPELDNILEKARYLMDKDERVAAYGQAEKVFFAQAPAIPLFYSKQYIAIRDNIKGIKMTIGGQLYLNDVVKE